MMTHITKQKGAIFTSLSRVGHDQMLSDAKVCCVDNAMSGRVSSSYISKPIFACLEIQTGSFIIQDGKMTRPDQLLHAPKIRSTDFKRIHAYAHKILMTIEDIQAKMITFSIPYLNIRIAL